MNWTYFRANAFWRKNILHLKDLFYFFPSYKKTDGELFETFRAIFINFALDNLMFCQLLNFQIFLEFSPLWQNQLNLRISFQMKMLFRNVSHRAASKTLIRLKSRISLLDRFVSGLRHHFRNFHNLNEFQKSKLFNSFLKS